MRLWAFLCKYVAKNFSLTDNNSMSEILELFPLRYPMLLPVLNTIGYWIKHHTSVRNEFIPPILFLIATGCSVGFRIMTTSYTGIMYYVDLVLLYGLINSLKLTLYAVGGYETVRAIRFSFGRRYGGIMKRPFIRVLLGFITATALFMVMALIFGSSLLDIFFKITDGWIFGILFLACFDFWSKFAKHREKINGVYITMLVMLLISVAMFSMASSADELTVCIVGLSTSVLFSIACGLCLFIPFIKEKKEMKKEKIYTFEELQEIWTTKIRPNLMKISDKNKKREILLNFLSYKLVDDDIVNGLDKSRGLCVVIDKDGKSYTVSPALYAKEYGTTDAVYKDAVDYIDLIAEEGF